MTGGRHDVVRQDVRFASGDSTCAATLHLPDGVTSPPVVVLGVGASREMRMDAFADWFAQAGIASLTFTYRHFGDSGGHPRQLLSIRRQPADWEAALAHVRARTDVDGSRVAIWGSSFGGVARDLVAAARGQSSVRHARKASKGEIRTYAAGHYDFYVGEPFEELVRDQTEFLVRNLAPANAETSRG